MWGLKFLVCLDMCCRVNVRIVAKLIFCSINIYLDMVGNSSKHRELACRQVGDSRGRFSVGRTPTPPVTSQNFYFRM
jgi:hypothetical protein